jgi:CubicO group peptidase (beta-lactamase class C family)
MRSRAALLIVASVLFTASTTPAQFAPPQQQPTFDERMARIEASLLTPVMVKGEPAPVRRLRDRMAALAVPAVSIAVFDNYQIAGARSYGVADVETKVVASLHTLFQAASISKPVAAAAALRLAERGRLSIDEDVNLRLRRWKVPGNEFTANDKVTLRHLLAHSGGLTVHGFRGYAEGEPVPTLVQVLDGEKPANSAAVKVDIPVGSRWRYSGGGYSVVQELLEDVSRIPFPRLMRETILQPAGMSDSTYEQPLPQALRGRAATGLPRKRR